MTKLPYDAETLIPKIRLLQDETQTYDSKALSRWFASRPNARQEAREAANEIENRAPAYRSSD